MLRVISLQYTHVQVQLKPTKQQGIILGVSLCPPQNDGPSASVALDPCVPTVQQVQVPEG